VRRWKNAGSKRPGKSDTLSRPQPQLGGISFPHRFGSPLNRHVRLHAYVTDGVLTSTTDGPTRDAAPAFLPMPAVFHCNVAESNWTHSRDRSTAFVLFLLVAINPKDAAYGSMPLFYAGCLVIVALAFNRASAWAARQAPPQP
jgi:hypothetical protein